MPAALLRGCSFPGGCEELVPHGRCKTHERESDKARAVKGAANENWRWNSWKWRKFSERWRRQYPFCGQRPDGLGAAPASRCAANGIVTQATEVDHMVPVKGPDDPLAFDPTNLASMCKGCHSAKTLRENR